MDPKIPESISIIPPSTAPIRPQGIPVQIPPTTTTGPSFRDVLTQQGVTSGAGLKFSAHAMQRLQSRNITLSQDDVQKMNVMADKAASKGAQQSLFMVHDVGMIVSIKNRTVITAVDPDSMRENVFTNIDSAAVIK
ncbi:MAG TPA: TIGR02530 family flagellar biosynthesis protein [Candidatus Baltobacteraceae bacterium]|jgi:flagellar operon protein